MITPPPTPRLLDSPPPAVQWEPLQKALWKRDPDAVRKALQSDDGAAILPLRNRQGMEPPLVMAVLHRCSSQIVQLLLQFGADVDDTGSSGLTPLMAIAAAQQPPSCLDRFDQLQVLLKEEVEMAAKYMPKLPPAFKLKTAGKLFLEDASCSLAVCLLRAKADPYLLDKQGRTAAQVAQEAGQPQLASLLEHWQNWEACRYLDALWNRQGDMDDTQDYSPELVHFPADIHGSLLSMLAPWPRPEIIGRVVLP